MVNDILGITSTFSVTNTLPNDIWKVAIVFEGSTLSSQTYSTGVCNLNYPTGNLVVNTTGSNISIKLDALYNNNAIFDAQLYRNEVLIYTFAVNRNGADSLHLSYIDTPQYGQVCKYKIVALTLGELCQEQIATHTDSVYICEPQNIYIVPTYSPRTNQTLIWTNVAVGQIYKNNTLIATNTDSWIDTDATPNDVYTAKLRIGACEYTATNTAQPCHTLAGSISIQNGENVSITYNEPTYTQNKAIDVVFYSNNEVLYKYNYYIPQGNGVEVGTAHCINTKTEYKVKITYQPFCGAYELVYLDSISPVLNVENQIQDIIITEPEPNSIVFTPTPSVVPTTLYATTNGYNLASYYADGLSHFTYKCRDKESLQIDFYTSATYSLPCRPDTSIICNCGHFTNNNSTIIPNPIYNTAQLILPTGKTSAEVVLYNINGALVQNFGVLTDNTVVDFADLPKGLYIISINDGENNIKSKIIKM